MLSAALGIRPVDVRIMRDPQGKPHLCTDQQVNTPGRDLHFNISHTRGLVAVALAGRPVGIDVETPAEILDRDQVARLVFAPESLAALDASTTDDARNALFYRFWTLGEAFKATGLGLAQPRQPPPPLPGRSSYASHRSKTAARWRLASFERNGCQAFSARL